MASTSREAQTQRHLSLSSLIDASSDGSLEESPGDEEMADADGCVRELLHPHFTPNPHEKLPVYMMIHRYV